MIIEDALCGLDQRVKLGCKSQQSELKLIQALALSSHLLLLG
jgi:hypothetical protein